MGSRNVGSRARSQAQRGISQRLAEVEAGLRNAHTINRMLRLALARERRKSVVSGVEIMSGRFDYEKTPELQGAKKWDTLAQLVNDPVVTESLRHLTYPLCLAQWDFAPATKQERDAKVADFCNAVVLGKFSDAFGPEYAMLNSWSMQTLPEILASLEHGFALFYYETQIVGMYRTIRQLKWLEPDSVDPQGWVLDEDTDAILEIKRTFRTPKGKFTFGDPLYPEELSLFVYGLRGARYTGREFVRPMFGAWWRKTFFQKLAAVWVQKIGAPSPYAVYPGNWKERRTDAIEDLRNFVMDIRGPAPEEAFGMFPRYPQDEPLEIKFAGVEAKADHLKGVIESENMELAHGGGTKTMMLGETASGSRALGSTLGMLEQVLVESLAATVSEMMLRGIPSAGIPGPVARMVADNFGPGTPLPIFRATKINRFELVQIAKEALPFIKAGVIPKTPELKRQITEGFGYRLEDADYELEPEPQDVLTPNGDPDGDPDNGDSDSDSGNAPKQDAGDGDPEDGDANAVKASRKPTQKELELIEAWLKPIAEEMRSNFWRPLTKLEFEAQDLELVRRAYTQGEIRLNKELKAIQAAMIAELHARVRSGKIDKRNLESQYRSKSKGLAKHKKAVMAVLTETAEQGSQHVRDEFKRVRNAKP